MVNGPLELGGPTSAWGGCEPQDLGEGLCLLQLMFQVPAQDGIVDGVLVGVVTLVHHNQREFWGRVRDKL